MGRRTGVVDQVRFLHSLPHGCASAGSRLRRVWFILAFAVFAAPAFLLAPPNPISSLSLSPTSVVGGSPSAGTVTLANAAPVGGALVALTSSNTSAAVVPSSITIQAGQTSGTFTVTTYPVASSTSATISASYSTGTKTATLTVSAAALTSVNVSPTSVSGGTPSTGTVSLNGPAPTAGATVTLSSSNSNAASVPGNVVLSSGANSATFTVTTLDVASSTAVTITAVYNGTTKTTTLTVTPAPPVLSSLTFGSYGFDGTALAGNPIGCTAYLNKAAPVGGAVVALSSSNASAATVPPTFTIPEGWNYDSFSVTPLPVTTDTPVTISGSYGGSTKTASLTVVATLTLTLDKGSGPIYTNQSTVAIKGHVAPISTGPGTTVTASLGAQSVTTTAASDGSFTQPSLTLAAGSNLVSVTASNSASGKTAGPVTATYIYETTPPTATVNFLTQIPDPTNQPTWTLDGTVSGYQGSIENAQVVVNGGTTRFSIAANATWSGTYTFSEGENLISFSVADLAGNLGPSSQQYRVDLHTQPIHVVFYNGGGILTANGGAWPGSLDDQYSEQLAFEPEGGGTLKGSHLDIFLDEPGLAPTGTRLYCPRDDLTCLGARHATPDLSLDITQATPSVSLPSLVTGLHTIRMVLHDPFGGQTERGAVVQVAADCCGLTNGAEAYYEPRANFAIPGTVTTQLPKIAGRIADGLYSIDCGDYTGAHYPTLSYFDSRGGGSFKPLPVKNFVNTGGIFEVTPDPAGLPQGKIPLTTNSSGQSVLRLSLTQQGGGISGQLTEYGRDICNTSGVVVSRDMEQWGVYYGGDSQGIVIYDLPYRAPNASDSPAPQIDTSATTPTTVVTDDNLPYTTRLHFRVTDLNGDLAYRATAVTPPGCGDASCVISARLDSDQKLTTTTPGGWYSALVSLAVGDNTFVISARDDAGHITNANLVITRTLTPVIAKITQPVTNGQTYIFANPRQTTFDASQSLNRTGSQLRYQWTAPSNISGGVTTWTQIATASTYSEYLSSAAYPYTDFNRRRVIASSMSIQAPDATSDTPCAGAAPGLCSTAVISFYQTCQNQQQIYQLPTISTTTGATVPIDLATTLTASWNNSNDTSALYEYRWDLINQATNQVYQIPQTAGPSGDGYATENRVLNVTFGSIPGVVPGTYTLTLSVASIFVGNPCPQASGHGSITITLVQQLLTTTAISPGKVLPGDTTPVLYGEGFDPQTQAILAGPVYSLTNLTTPLCNVSQGQCPIVVLPGAVNTNGTAMGFAVPGSTAPGVYYVLARTGAGQQTGVGQYLMVQTVSVTYPAVPAAQKSLAQPLIPGQAVQGTFVANSDPSGKTSDVNLYYFFGTAGSTITVDLQRADTSLPWEHPDALDPQVRITAPDGLIYANLSQIDNQPGIDLNATLTNAVLPQTGIYLIAAETTKGGGNYALNFSFGSVVPVPAGARAIPFLGNYNTAAVNKTISSTAMMLDPRGYPLAGAGVTFTSSPATDDLGALEFPGGSSVRTTGEGFAIIRTLLTRAGKVEFAPVISDAHLQRLHVTGAVQTEIPRYAPVASAPLHVTEVLAGGLLRVEEGPRKELPAREHKHALYVHDKQANAKRASKAFPISSGLPEELKRPLPASGLKPQGSLDELAITSCSPSIFVQAGVNTGTVTPPLTATFTDESPPTGGGEPVGVLTVANGIKGHRIQKTIRLKIDIKDGTGSAPAYPVLVHLSVGGPRHGTLILDPDGLQLRCDQATFLWHERDAYGNIIALNEEFKYELGTFSGIAGFVADPANLGKVKPVWGLAEMLNVAYGVIDQTGAVTFTAFGFPVQPEPGKPDHFVGNATSHDPTGDLVELWSDYGTYEIAPPPVIAASFAEFNAYYLLDQFDNPTFGYVNSSGTSSLPNVTVSLADQTSGDPTVGSDVDFFGYQVSVVWSDNPTMPQGNQGASISVGYPSDPDGDWQAGQVTKNVTLQFDRGNFHFVQPWYHYEATLPDGNPGVDDGIFPLVVAPEAQADALPKTSAGDAPRLVLLTLTGTRFPVALPYPDTEPFPDGHKYWQRTCPEGATCPPYVYSTYQTHDPHDPRLEVADSPTFALSLVDTRGNVITDGVFQVDLCPRYDHDSPNPPDQPARECTIAPIQSRNGVISDPPITVNSGNASPDDARGYIGIELVKAPRNPGDYFIDVRSLSQNYRVREESNLLTNGEYQSAFRFVTVIGGQILDGNFRLVTEIAVPQPTTVYVRYVSPTEPGSAVTVDVSDEDEAGNVTASLPGVTAARVGSSSSFLSPPITLQPPNVLPISARPLSAQATSTGLVLAVGTPTSKIKAKRSAKLIAKCDTQGPVLGHFFVDTTLNGAEQLKDGSCIHSVPPNTARGQRQNLIFANGAASTTVSAYVETPETDCGLRRPVIGQPVEAAVVDPATGSLVSSTATTDSNGWAQFEFTAPDIPQSTAVVDGQVYLTSRGYPIATGLAHVYSFNAYQFQAMDISMGDLTAPGISDAQMDTILNTAYSQPSFLTKTFFAGDDAFYDADGNGVYNPGPDPPFYDGDGDGVFNGGGEPIETARTVFANAARDAGLNPFILMVHAQREQQLISRSINANPPFPLASTLSKAMGIGSSDFRDQIDASAERTAGYKTEPTIRNDGLNFIDPLNGPVFFFSRLVPVESANFGESLKIGWAPGTCPYYPDSALIPYSHRLGFRIPDRSSYVMWRYNSFVQVCTHSPLTGGGGNRLTQGLLNKFHQVLGP